MQGMLRHLGAILVLPFVVVIVVPYWLTTSFAAGDTRWSDGSLIAWVVRPAGAVLILTGFVLFSWCVSLFARVGQGTLAPWDSTRHLVAVGPYRHVRNPMISGVAMMLGGQAVIWGSWILGLWAGAFIAFNHLYFMLLEEPGLASRFGREYERYKVQVPRWVPRLRPWSGK